MRRHVMTPARKRALRKAQLASARARKRVTVYHYTTPRKAAKIVKQQRFKPHGKLRAPGNVRHQVYVTRRTSKFYKTEFRPMGRQSAVVSFTVQGRHIKRDPNDKWFKQHAMMYGKNRPPNAYMIHKQHLVGTKIRHL